MSAGSMLGAGDIEFSDHGSNETTDSMYRSVAIYLDNDGVEDLWKPGDPMANVATLMEGGDHWALNDDPVSEQWRYEAAAHLVLDPAIQLEIGCCLLQRAEPGEAPLCEHMYTPRSFQTWQPQVIVHEDIGHGPPSLNREGTVQLAAEAYANAWFFYSVWPTGKSTKQWPRFAVSSLVRSLFALDGLRVCCERLDDVRNLSRTAEWLNTWFKECEYRIGDFGGDLSEIVAEIRERFARTSGRLEPMITGRTKAQARLERELKSGWERLPQTSRDYLVDAEWKRQVLRDPSFTRWDFAHSYCLAIEALLRYRLGNPLRVYLKEAAKPEGAGAFRRDFLHKNTSPNDITINEFERYLRNRRFKRALADAGVDSAFVFTELPGYLRSLLPYRNRAGHATPDALSEGGLDRVRGIVMAIISGVCLRPARASDA